jgi:nucleotide-binding universal stress UspA family protein
MRNTLLVPLDGTPIAEAGLSWATGAARKSGATLHLLSVKEPGVDDAALVATVSYLDLHVERLRAQGLEAHAEVKLGKPAARILQEARYADIAVLTSGTTRWIVSPVLDEILLKMTTPVVLVRGDRNEWASASNFERILLSVSQSNYSSQAIPIAQRFAMMFEAEIILHHNVSPACAPASPEDSPFASVTTSRTEVDLSQAEEYVERVASDFRARGLNVRPVVSAGEPAQQIVSVGREYGAGLIAMATRGRERLESRIAGSVANVVLETTPIPCLLIRTGAPAPAGESKGHAGAAVADSVADSAV